MEQYLPNVVKQEELRINELRGDVMRKQKIAYCALAFILISVLLVGCNDRTFSMTMPKTVAPLLAPSGVLNTSTKPVISGANDFAFSLSAALAEHNGDSNLICSPFSVWLPLAALVNAIDTANQEVLLATLGSAGIKAEDINNAASRMLYDLTNQRETLEHTYNPLRIINAVFVDNTVTLQQDFAQVFADYYRGISINVDLQSQDAVDAVNMWASNNTNGLIQDIVQRFGPNTLAVVANAIYFSDRWQWEFNPEDTKEDIFHSPTGDETAHFMLREGSAQLYYEDEKLQAIPLNFKTGGGMYILLPKDGDATGLLTSMTEEYFSEIQANADYATGKLLLPRFSVDSGAMDLKDVLSTLGVPLFDESSAPLTGGLIEEDMPIWLSAVMQKALIKVDEKGTTAAVVTVVVGDGASLIEFTGTFDMKCDQPFVFILYDDNISTGVKQVLFTGIVNHMQ